MSDYLDPDNEELLKDFFAEAEQQVETLESNILVIESDPSNHEAVDEIFRAAHTLKGGSATVEFNELSEFTHKVEDVLDEIRSDRLQVTEDIIDILLTSIDVIKAMLEARQNGSVYEEDVSELVAKLESYVPKKDSKKKHSAPPSGFGPKLEKVEPSAAPSAPAANPANPFNYPPLSEEEFEELKNACEGKQKVWRVAVKFDENNPMNSVGGIQVFAALKALGSVLKTVPDFDALYEDEFYECVYYYLASDSTADKIEDVAFLGDVTVATDAQEITGPVAGNSGNSVSAEKSAAPENTEPENAEKTVNSDESKTVSPVAQLQKTEEKKQAVPAAKAVSPAKSSAANQQNSVLRVDSKRVDYLLNLVSEIVITKASFNQLSANLTAALVDFHTKEILHREKMHQFMEMLPTYLEDMQHGKTINEVRSEISRSLGSLADGTGDDDTNLKSLSIKLRSSTQNLGRIASELQEGVMKIRMVQINQIFSRFPRVVRDLQRDLNKKINLVIEGEDTELDKAVVEDLLDPIMHCVRNSCDHGIETPEERIAAGKPEAGTVLLKASNEGNLIIIDISDDGAGIDAEKVRQKAIEKGIIHPDKVLSENEIHQLIFEPGFSTADKISKISGRGVGLDVVKTMIDKLNGTVNVTSQKGKGTTFSIRLPLTLAIIQGLLVRVGKEIYSIPIASVIESQRILHSDIKTIDNYEVLNLRNEVISVLRLSRLFGIKESASEEYCNIVIVGSKDRKVGVMVDSLIGEEDVVIKPLKDQYTASPGIAGASILGDGSVSLIIDVSQLLELSIKMDTAAQSKMTGSK
ncbi:MAG: chemotaxis protein CheA [Treponema sp.]|nr:chemotaxis protein CheA [Treponema sp.]